MMVGINQHLCESPLVCLLIFHSHQGFTTNMNIPQRSLQASPKFAKLYSRLFEGIPITEICGPNQTQDHDQFYDELLTLEIDRDFVAGKLANTSRDVLLGASKVRSVRI